jgi:putative ABC transport system permease protein
MNLLLFVIKSAFEDFRRNKVRTALTSLGILIGVASVVLLMALGLGLKTFIANQFESLGTNLLIIFPGEVLDESGSFRGGESTGLGQTFDSKDTRTLERIRSLQYVAPVYTRSIKASYGSKVKVGDIFATTPNIFELRKLEAAEGKIFTESDIKKRSKVAVIGPKIVEKLFDSPEQAVGRNIKLDTQTFKVIGVLKAKSGGGLGGPDFDSYIYVPHTSALAFNPDKTFLYFYIKVQSEIDIPSAKKAVETAFLRRYDDSDFSVIEQSEILNAVTSIFGVLNNVLVLIGGISLVVGGIGIMNIMYVTVVERIKEIGIRRAIGATRQDILLQFLTESVLLSVIGGIGGLLVASAIVLLINQYFPAVINFTSVALAIGVSSAVGVGFGVFPARKAANLSPIDAIRYE